MNAFSFKGEFADFAEAIGLTDGTADTQSAILAWLGNPLDRIASILSDPGQRAAFFRLLDTVLPPAGGPEIPAGEKWHPLLAEDASGNLYLTVREQGADTILGIAGAFGTTAVLPPPARPIAARIDASIALVRLSGSSVTPLPGTPDGPLAVRLRVGLNLQRQGAAAGLALDAIVIESRLSPASAGLLITLEGLSFAPGDPPVDKLIDPEALGREAPELIAGLIKLVVDQDPVAAGVLADVLGLLGLGDSSVPAFPFAELASDADAVRRWLASLFDGAAAGPIQAWLLHFAGLFKALLPGAPAVAQAGAALGVDLIPFAANSALRLLVSFQNGHFRPALVVRASVPVEGKLATIECGVTLADIQTLGAGHPAVLPEAHVRIEMSGAGGDPLVPLNAGFGVGALRTGIGWNGAALVPLIELADIDFQGMHYSLLDLSNTDSVAAAASNVVTQAIDAALGNGAVARRLAALAGLAPPRDPANPAQPLPGWPHALDLGRFVTDPTGAIAAYHRAVLRSANFGWDRLFGELLALIGAADAVEGAGTPANPWRIPLGPPVGAMELALAAWNAQTSGNAGDPQQLRLGLRLGATSEAVAFGWLAEVLAFDLPAAGSGHVAIVGAQHLAVTVEPAFAGTMLDGAAGPTIGLSVERARAALDWTPGDRPQWQVELQGLHIQAGADAIDVVAIAFPPPAGFDLANPAAAAAKFGLTPETLAKLLALLATQASGALGPQAARLTGLLGMHSHAPGLPADWPNWIDPAAADILLTDPLAALRSWLKRLLCGVSADGVPHVERWIAQLGEELLELDDAALIARLAGAGTYDEPWTLPAPIGGDAKADGAHFHLWLDPEGPPLALLGGLAAQIAAAASERDLIAILRRAAAFHAPLRARMSGRSDADLATGLSLLGDLLARSDGMVPLASQQPQIAGWTQDPAVAGAHWTLPGNAAVIGQVGAKVDALAGGPAADRLVLLLAPDHARKLAGGDVWASLLASPAIHGVKAAGALFDLADSSIPDPATYPLDSVTTVADWYVAYLPGDDLPDWDALASHIGRIVARMAQLRPGVAITLVAHSVLGIAARHFVAGHQAGIAGLLTLGTPHFSANLPFLADPELADAIRLTALLAPGMNAGAGRSALEQLLVAIDGYDALPGAVAPARPLPFAAFDASAAGLDTGVVPIHCIGADVSGSPLPDLLRAGLGALVGTLAGGARAAPSHAGLSVSIPLDLPSSGPGAIGAEARLRFDLLTIALDAAGVPSVRPAHGMRFSARLFRSNGWLLGNPSTLPLGVGVTDPRAAFDPVRLCEMEIGLDAAISGGSATGRPWLRLRDAAVRGPTIAVAEGMDSFASAAIGAVFDSLTKGSQPTSGAAAKLIDALDAIGLLSHDAEGVVGLSQDGWNAITADPIGFLAARMAAALDRAEGWLGLRQSDPTGPWLWSPTGGITLSVARSGTPARWTARLQAGTPDAARGGSAPRFAVDAQLALPSLAAQLDFTAAFGAFAATLHSGGGSATLSVGCPPWADAITVVPAPNAAQWRAVLSELWPRLVFAGGLSAALHGIAPGLRLGAVERLLNDTGAELRKIVSGGGGTLSVTAFRDLLGRIAAAAGLPPDGGLTLPGNLVLMAETEAGSQPPAVLVRLATGADIGGALGFDLGVRIDSALHAAPFADIALRHNVNGTWGQVGIVFGAGPQGVTLAIEQGAGVSPIMLLPSFSGLGALRGAAAALLPAALDQIVQSFAPRPQWLQHLLDLAAAFELYDPVGGFAAKTTELAALLDGNAAQVFDGAAQDGIAQALVALANSLPALPVAVTRSGNLARVAFGLPAAIPGEFALLLGFGAAGPSIGLSVSDVVIANRISFALDAVAGSGTIVCGGHVGVNLSDVHVPLSPRFAFSAAANGGFQLSTYPLAANADDGPLEIHLAPQFQVTLGGGSAEQIVTHWLLPLVANTLVGFADSEGLLARKLWPTGPDLRAVLAGAQLITAAPPASLRTPLPDVWTIVAGAFEVIANGVHIPIGSLELSFVSSPAAPALPRRLGLTLKGMQTFDAGDISVNLLLGAPDSWEQTVGGDAGTTDVAKGLELFLIKLTNAGPSIAPVLGLQGIGIGLHGSEGRALVDEPAVRIGGIDAYFFGEIDTVPSLQVVRLGGGIEISDFGLPLGAVTSGGGGGNPVVTALLSDGGTTPGDNRAPTPGVDLAAWYREDDRLHIRMYGGDGGAGVLWIGVHSQFGPIYIDQVGVGLTSESASLLVDGGVSVAGLTAQVDDLSLTVPFRHPEQVTLDLKGLGLGYSGPGVTLSGGLKKYSPPIEYDGMLVIKIGNIGAVAVGSYAVPEADGSSYTALAVFGGVFVPIGLTPVINITGLGLGLGLNRRLIVPDDLNQIPSFMLIQALDRPEELANDPLGALLRFRDAVPPRRGSFWLAAGLRGTSFEIVNITAVLYVALDSGVEIGLLGVARAALPADDLALVSLELALKARFSTAEMLLSIQAQLTDNSWLLSEDCQLTGGFAFFMWFRESQFLLSIGGYHPAFQHRPEYPNVPRLGYRWNLLDVIQIKGESYFALTNSCVMAGVSMDLTYGPDWLQLWFSAHADFLAQWDPFHFTADVGISVGARLRVEVCFIACAHINISVSVGATLHLEGPPIHGTCTVDLEVTSVTVPFGDRRNASKDLIGWAQFRQKYLQGGDPATLPVDLQVDAGLLKPDPPGGKIAPGTADQPWKLAPEWRFHSETRMPVRAAVFVADANPHGWAGHPGAPFSRIELAGQTHDLDIAPMGKESVDSVHKILLFRRQGNQWLQMAANELDPDRFIVEPIFGQVSEATYHYIDGKPAAAANTLPAALGLTISGVCELRGHTPDPIPIAKLVDEYNHRPLPFAKPSHPAWVQVQIAGRTADRFARLSGKSPSHVALKAVGQMLSGSGTAFARNRADSGIHEPGLGPVAHGALLAQRSAPPLVAPLSTGLSMQPVGRKIMPVVAPPEPVRPVELAAPRLRAVMQARVAASAAGGPALRTTVSGRMRKQSLGNFDPARKLSREADLLGARLELVGRADAPAATRLASGAASLRSPQVGASTAPRDARAFAELEKGARGDGAALRAGATQLWDVPAGEIALRIEGDQAVRVTMLSRGGTVIDDLEFAVTKGLRITLPPRCAAVAVAGLGRLGALEVGWPHSPATGAVTAFAAPSGAICATGWQSNDQALQISGSTLLVRGSTVRLTTRAEVARRGQNAPFGAVTMAAALADASAVETTLPSTTAVVAIIVESADSRLPDDSDLGITIRNADLDRMPVRVGAGSRTIFLFDVHTPEGDRQSRVPIVVGAVTGETLRIAGTVGLSGSAKDWGLRLNGHLPDDWIADGPLTVAGVARVRFEAEKRAYDLEMTNA